MLITRCITGVKQQSKIFGMRSFSMYLGLTIVAGNLETERKQREEQESVKRGMLLLKASG